MSYEPPFTVTERIADYCMRISEELGRMSVSGAAKISPRLRRVNRLRSIHSSLAIENNSLSLDEVTDVVNGRSVAGPEREIQEVKNAFVVYGMMDDLDPYSVDDLLKAHGAMMKYLVPHEGEFRKSGEGVFDAEGNCVHMAPPAENVPFLVKDLLEWVRTSDYPVLIKSCVFHYEFEFIHPFEDGNGRMGRFWHTLLLSKWKDVFRWVPVESAVRRHQKQYYESIVDSNREGDSTRFLESMLSMIQESLEEFSAGSAAEKSGAPPGLTRSESMVYDAVRKGEFTTIADVSALIGVSESTVARALASMKDKGLIERTGSKKAGKWAVVPGTQNAVDNRH